MTTTQDHALEAMVADHTAMRLEIEADVASIELAGGAGRCAAREVAKLVAYFAGEVLPHALAEEHTVYSAARAIGGLSETVAAMTAEHRALALSVEDLASTNDDAKALALAREIAERFGAHVSKENEVILPALFAEEAVDLAALLVRLHHLSEAAKNEQPFAEEASGPEMGHVLVRMLVSAADDLAELGKGERACRLMAAAWAAVRTERPDLAVRLTATLHRLVRHVPEGSLEAFASSSAAASSPTDGENLDVRPLAPAERHELIFATCAALAPGTSFVLVNDHDPKPLRYQFEAEHPGEFTWDYLEQGPEVFRVRVGRPDRGPSTAKVGTEKCLDVRALPHAKRHETIFATYLALERGAGFVLVNDHDPKPLRYQFEAEHPGEFTWDYLEQGPEIFRVRIGKIDR